ncbi:MAG: acyl-CoA/acyl-ACP dehydrogenase [Desulfatibacillum sp.]|nr:acyl-CoA/acyl-ACP dehydrogenase [Desulfatibacillum sp.]
MDEKLSREHEMILDAVRYWVKKQCPRTETMAWDESNQLPPEILSKFKELDLWAMGVDEQFGGTGRDWLGITLVVETLAEMEPVLAGLYATDMWGAATIAAMGTEEQKASFLPQLTEGKLPLARVKPSQPLEETIQFRQGQSGWILNGACKQVDFAQQAQMLVVQATAENNPDLTSQFLLSPSSEGVEISPLETLGYRSAGSCSIELHDVYLSLEAILGQVEKINPMAAALAQGAWNLLMAAQATGMAQGAMAYALEHAKGRVQFNQPIGNFPAIREKLTELSVMIRASRLMVRTAAALADAGQKYHAEAAQALLMASSTAEKAGLEGIQILGGYGYSLEYDAQRYFRNAMQLVCSGVEKSSLYATIGKSMGLTP